jgi:hypothetical protein
VALWFTQPLLEEHFSEESGALKLMAGTKHIRLGILSKKIWREDQHLG